MSSESGCARLIHTLILNNFFTGILSWLTIGSIPFHIETSVHPILVIAFRTKHLLGRKTLLYGFVVFSIITHQHSYYADIGSRKIGKGLGSELICHMRIIIQIHWIYRNHTLHDTEAHARIEWPRGTGDGGTQGI